jgi:MscS family membrane protein
MNPTSSEATSILSYQFFLMSNWKWLALILVIIAGFLLQSILKSLLTKVKNWPVIDRLKNNFWEKLFQTEIEKPLSWLGTFLFWMVSVDSLQMHLMIEKYLVLAIKVGFAAYLIFLGYKAADAIGSLLIDRARKSENPLDDQLAPMATKVLKFVVLILGILLTLDNLGVKVTPMLAGLGLGSLAFALAAQDTVANLFGSVTIVADRAFQIGDWIKVGETEGTVEDIGFRSTRIRTFYNSVVTVPNSVMAKEKIDNLGERPSLRIRHTFGFTYDAQADQIRHFMSLVEEYLENHPKVQKENFSVNFVAMGDFSLQVLVNFYITARVGDEEREIQQEFLFFVMELAQKLKLEFAFPTATHYVKS